MRWTVVDNFLMKISGISGRFMCKHNVIHLVNNACDEVGRPEHCLQVIWCLTHSLQWSIFHTMPCIPYYSWWRSVYHTKPYQTSPNIVQPVVVVNPPPSPICHFTSKHLPVPHLAPKSLSARHSCIFWELAPLALLPILSCDFGPSLELKIKS